MLVIVVADGVPDPADARLLDAADLLIAADGGARWLEDQGRLPGLVVGDLDSLEGEALERLARAGSRVERHPTEKDASDTELALAAAVTAGADRIVVLGAMGGPRLDHELANLLLLVDPALRRRDVRIVRGAAEVRAMTGGSTLVLDGGVGDTVTLVPVGGDAIGVTTQGLRYALHGETLPLGTSRGLSNEVVQAPASVRLRVGSLLVVETRNTTEGER
jgi:thiamine pyrophosphokinase